MAQNTSTAVMQRRVEAHDSLDDFPTPPWGTRALCVMLRALGHRIDGKRAWEPCANRGYMVRPLAEHFGTVFGSDVHDYGAGFQTRDFLMPSIFEDQWDWVVCNPPFRLGDQFLDRALDVATDGVAILARTVWAEGAARYRDIFEHRPPSHTMLFTQRITMVKGRCVPSWAKHPDDHTSPKLRGKNITTATSYSWFVWDKHSTSQATRAVWIPPVRDALETPEDYPEWDGNGPAANRSARVLEAQARLLLTGMAG